MPKWLRFLILRNLIDTSTCNTRVKKKKHSVLAQECFFFYNPPHMRIKARCNLAISECGVGLRECAARSNPSGITSFIPSLFHTLQRFYRINHIQTSVCQQLYHKSKYQCHSPCNQITSIINSDCKINGWHI